MAREEAQERFKLPTIEADLRAQRFKWLSDSEQTFVFVDNKARIEFGAYWMIFWYWQTWSTISRHSTLNSFNLISVR
jgi:hypothetical protein